MPHDSAYVAGMTADDEVHMVRKNGAGVKTILAPHARFREPFGDECDLAIGKLQRRKRRADFAARRNSTSCADRATLRAAATFVAGPYRKRFHEAT